MRISMPYAGKSFRFPRPAAWLPALAWAAVLGFTAWVAAGWYWRLAAPRNEQAVASVVTDVQAVTREITSRNLFGMPVQAQSSGPVVVSNSRYKLIGVAANSGTTPGFAILKVDDKDSLAAIEGQEIEPGVKLLRVLPRAVEIERNGMRETLPLDEGAAGVPPPPVVQGAAPPQQTPQAPPPPPDNMPTPRGLSSMRSAPNAPPDAPTAPQRDSNSD